MNTPDIEDILGPIGRMISGSKSSYWRAHPDNLVIFNANVCTDTGKVWYGDLDITKDSVKLKEAAETMNCRLYVLYEHDARFDNEAKPLLEKAVVTFAP
jgi:hypothetical protein